MTGEKTGASAALGDRIDGSPIEYADSDGVRDSVRTTLQDTSRRTGTEASSGPPLRADTECECSGGAHEVDRRKKEGGMSGGVEDMRSRSRACKDADGGALMTSSGTALEQGIGSIGTFSATRWQRAVRLPLRDRAKGVSAFFREDNQRDVYALLGALVALLVAVFILSFVVVANHSRILAPSQSSSPTVVVGTAPGPSTAPTPVDGDD